MDFILIGSFKLLLLAVKSLPSFREKRIQETVRGDHVCMSQWEEKPPYLLIPAPHFSSHTPGAFAAQGFAQAARGSPNSRAVWGWVDEWNVFFASQEHLQPFSREIWFIHGGCQDDTTVQLWVKCIVLWTWPLCTFCYGKNFRTTNKHIFVTLTLYKLWLTSLVNWELNLFPSYDRQYLTHTQNPEHLK